MHFLQSGANTVFASSFKTMLHLDISQRQTQDKLCVQFKWTDCEQGQDYVLSVTDKNTREISRYTLPRPQCEYTQQFPLGHVYVAYIMTTNEQGKMKFSTMIEFGSIATTSKDSPEQPPFQITVLRQSSKLIEIGISRSITSSHIITVILANTTRIPCEKYCLELVCDGILQLYLKSGNQYTLTATSPNKNDQQEIIYSFNFCAELNMTEILQLLQRANQFVSTQAQGNQFMECVSMYRNKSVTYFHDIFRYRGGIMEKYLKNSSGDLGSPINWKLKGLYFSVKPDKRTGSPPLNSMFGPVRLHIPPSNLCTADTNLYFADFYCAKAYKVTQGHTRSHKVTQGHTRSHKVILVVTLNGSEADHFCKQRLVQLDPCNNQFWMKSISWSGHLMREIFLTSMNVRVDIFYTENIDLRPYWRTPAFDVVDYKPTVTSTSIGIPKNTHCSLCNL